MHYKNLDELFDAVVNGYRVASTVAELPNYKNYSNTRKESTVYLEEMDNHYLYELPVPGLTKDTIAIKLKNGKVEVTGGIDGHKWSPLFTRSFSLPKNADVKTVKASVENGVLYIKIDKDKEFETTIKIV